MNWKIAKATSPFFSPGAVFPFLVGSVFLAVLGNGAFSLLCRLLGNSVPALISIMVGAVVIFFLMVIALRAFIGRRPVLTLNPRMRSPSKHAALVVLANRRTVACKAIEHHRPRLKRVVMVCSARDASMARDLEEEYRDVAFEPPRIVSDIYDPIEAKDATTRAIRDLAQETALGDIIVDFTGLTSLCSIGAVLAALPLGCNLQYTPATHDQEGKVTGSAEPIEITLDWARGALATQVARKNAASV